MPARSRAAGWLLPLILLAAAGLRFAGLAWGLPCARHWFSYHPDEALILLAASKVNVFAGQLDPGFYNYGSLFITLISATTRVLDAWSPLAQPWQELARMTLVGRAWAALAGTATIYVVYLIGRRLAGRRAGLLAAAILAVVPMGAMHAHFATVDVPATFLVALALYQAVRYPEGGWRAAALGGLFAGLAAGTKYNAGLAVVAVVAAAALHREAPARVRLSHAALAVGVAALAFLLATPGVLLNTPAFLRDFLYETRHVRTGHGLVFVNTGPGWWYHLQVNLWQGIGAFLPLAALAAVLRRREGRLPDGARRGLAAVSAFGVLYFALIAAAAVRFQRYDLPLLPVLAVWGGILLARCRGRWAAVPTAALLGTLVLAMGAVSTMSSPRGDLQMTGQPYAGDPRDAVFAWFDRQVPAGRTVGLASAPWFFTPPFVPSNAGPQSPNSLAGAATMRWPLSLPDNAARDGWTRWPDLVVLSDYEYGDALRLQGGPVVERAAQIGLVTVDPASPPEAQRLARLWNNVVSRYTLVGVWSPRQHALGFSWPKRALPPHDAFYPYPTLIVFRRSGR